jgi:hypothetical protein
VSNPKEGWGFPGLARKAHYFVEDKTLCGKWAYTGSLDGSSPEVKGPDDCAACRRLFDARVKTNG